MEKEFIFSIDLGGTSSKVAILKTDGKILEKWEIPTNKAENGKFIVEEIYYSFNKKINELNIKPDQFFGIGMGAPGPVLKDGRITRAVNIGWENYPLKAELERPSRYRHMSKMMRIVLHWASSGWEQVKD